MTSRYLPAVVGTAVLVAASVLSGCTVTQDAIQVGQREYSYDTGGEAESSGESFRFQGFLPDDATSVRLVAQLDGHASVMRWESATPFASEHCTDSIVTSKPDFSPKWLIDPIPTTGVTCGVWTIVNDGDLHLAWRGEE